MFNVFDKYMIRQLALSTVVVSFSLSVLIMLAQSLRLIEVVLEANASASAFITMMALSMPRFLEAVLPASVLISTIFVLYRLTADSEMIVMRASGASPLRLATPAIKTGFLLAGILLVLSLWVSPLGISNVQVLKKQAQAEYGHLLFREGVFNSVGKNLTAYVRTKSPDGQLTGLLVHDTRDGKAVTVIARSGQIISDDAGQKMIVYDGSRQEEDKITNKFSRLDFKQYTLEIPSTVSDTSERWRKPDERTFNELTHALKTQSESARDLKEFRSELHRRFTTPILMVSFVALAAAFLLQGGFARGGQIRLMIMAAITALFFQGIYLLVYNMAKESMLGCVLLYVSALTPLALGVFFLTPLGEKIMINVMVVASRIRKTIP